MSSSSLSQQEVELQQQNPSLIENSTSPQPSSLKCKYSTSNSTKSEPPELFSWNREQVRQNSEYVDKKFSKAFSNIAPELRIIGGLGPIKCINKKKNGHPKLVNRPTQVQKISHTTTKVLPNFNFTEQLKPIVCARTKHMSVDEHVEKVKIADNLPISDESSIRHGIDTMKSFKHENPFNLDLNALSEYQKQRSNAEDAQRRRNSQIIRRTMETKKLKTEGAERIKQEERNEKFRLPAFFRISHDDDETMVVETGDVDVFFFNYN